MFLAHYQVIEKKQYADRAMAVLTHAITAGYANAVHLKDDDDFAAIRSRLDFKKLVADLEVRHRESEPRNQGSKNP